MFHLLYSQIYLQMDCPSVRHWAYVSIFAVDVCFQIWDQFWIPHWKCTEHFSGIFVKPQNGFVWPVFTFFFDFLFVISIKHRFFELKIDVLASRTCILSVNQVRDHRFSIICMKIDEYELSYRWYARTWYYREHARNQLDFLN